MAAISNQIMENKTKGQVGQKITLSTAETVHR